MCGGSYLFFWEVIDVTRLEPKAAFEMIGCRYDCGMHKVRTGELAGTFYRIGNRVFFVKEKLELWVENQVAEAAKEAGSNKIRALK